MGIGAPELLIVLFMLALLGAPILVVVLIVKAVRRRDERTRQAHWAPPAEPPRQP